MQNNPYNIFGQKSSAQNQQRLNIFDKVHTPTSQGNFFSLMSPPNNKDQKIENKTNIPIDKIPATNIFTLNPTPATNIFSQNTNIFAAGSSKT